VDTICSPKDHLNQTERREEAVTQILPVRGKRVCRSPNCGGLVPATWSVYCSACRHRDQRHGHPSQRGVSHTAYAYQLAHIKSGITRLPHHLRQELELRIAKRVAVLAEFCVGLTAPGSEVDALGRRVMYRTAGAFLARALNSEHCLPVDLVLDTMARALHWQNDGVDAPAINREGAPRG
jgi:hypothetical protein